MDRRTFLRSTGVLLGGTSLSVETVRGTDGKRATIFTDAYGVSHVYAEDLYALAFGNGYVQARDRLFEMDVLRHVGYGDSAGVLGPSQLQSDIEVRRDLYSKAEIKAQYERASERTQLLLDAFADGVNRKMIEMATHGQLPGTFTALAHAPEPWSAMDSIAALSYLIGRFGIGGGDELANARELARLKQSLDDEQAAYEAFGDRNWLRIRETHTTSIEEAELTVDGGEDVPNYEDVPDEQLRFVNAALGAEPWGIETDFSLVDLLDRRGKGVMEGFKWGSNALIVSGEHAETGQPMLGGGPQMGYFKPPVIHQIGLHGADYDVTGIGTVGAPGVIVGRTPEFAWTVTSGRDDQVDTIAVDLHPEDDHRYEWNGEYHEMATETVVHRASILGSIVEGDPDVRVVEQEVARIEENGSEMPVIAWNPAERVAWCQRTTTRHQELDAALMWANIGTENDIAGFKERLSAFPFTFNFHYVDEENIAFIHTGKVPERNPALDHRLPTPGAAHEWQELRVGLGLETHVTNPSSGYVVNWNNGPCAGWRAGDRPQQWGSAHRVDLLDRLTRKAIENGPISLADVKRIIERAGTRDAAASYTVPALVQAGRTSDDDQLRSMADELDQWRERGYPWRDDDGDGRYDSGGMAIWEETRRELQRLAFEDELGDLSPVLTFDPPVTRHAADHGRARQETTLVDALAGRTDHQWLAPDGGAGDSHRSSLRSALTEAAKTLEDRYDSADPSEWLLSVRRSTFRSLGASLQTSIEMVNRATYNQAVAMGTGLDGSRHVLAPANSGHMSFGELLATQLADDEPDRLTDQLEEYVAFEYVPNAYTREQVESIATDRHDLTVSSPSLDEPLEPTGQLSVSQQTRFMRRLLDQDEE
ncbi:penicillin acylase family protein [Halocatena pleomorpha]|uniref:Penicillin acylase family protein n=1 Tax=Halocatena pleomorpha TaxID=1785090 RepID=A0A3P3RH36_9EURY|nr:penicillin acylase family protein [Halocatena pleomorpha]RRJ32179.1 penicillin acylase family protein [Halocatena pleomorpha]